MMRADGISGFLEVSGLRGVAPAHFETTDFNPLKCLSPKTKRCGASAHLKILVTKQSFQTRISDSQPLKFKVRHIKPVQIHNLGPGCNKIIQEFYMGIVAGIHFGYCPQF